MLSEAHSSLALIRAREYEWQDAERIFRRAIQLNPNNALAHLELGASVLVVQGRFEEGLKEVSTAAALDPLSPYVNTEFGRALVLAGHDPEAVDRLRHAITLDPSRNRPYTLLGRALYLQGNADEALKVFDDTAKRASGLVPPPNGAAPVPVIFEWQACAEARAGRREQAVALMEQQRLRGTRPQVLALAYACVGDTEHSLAYLEKALEEGQAGLAETVQSPEMAWMRSNPRVTTLRQKLNLTP
jgi:tetratricopeptide (TPR) repeat protein